MCGAKEKYLVEKEKFINSPWNFRKMTGDCRHIFYNYYIIIYDLFTKKSFQKKFNVKYLPCVLYEKQTFLYFFFRIINISFR